MKRFVEKVIRCNTCGEEIRNEMFITNGRKWWHMRCRHKDPEKTKASVRQALIAAFARRRSV